MATKAVTMVVGVDYDPEVTDPQKVAEALDILLDAAKPNFGLINVDHVGLFIPVERVQADVYVRSLLCAGCESNDDSSVTRPAACQRCWTLRPTEYRAKEGS
jgi:hypothetical protein